MSAKRTPYLLAASLSFINACAASTPPAAPPASAAVQPTASVETPGPAAFDWPVSVAVPVRETTLKGKSKVEIAYHLEVCPAGPGAFTVAHRDLRFVSLDGVPGDDPSLAPTIRRLAPVMAAIPEMVVSDAGRYQGVQGWDEVLAELEKALPEEDRGGLRRLRDDPRLREVTSQAVGHRWRTWVETWLDFDPSKGAQQTVTMPVHLGSKPLELRVELSSEPGPSEGTLSLSATTRAGGRKAREILADLLGRIGAEGLDPESFEIEVISIQQVDIRWPSLRPERAHSRKEIYVSHEGRRTDRVEDRTYVFDWESAVPAQCGTP